MGSAADCDVVIRHPNVSARHRRFFVGADCRCFVDDLNSTNVTFVNDKAVRLRTELTATDRIGLGHEVVVPCPPDAPQQTQRLFQDAKAVLRR